MQSPMIHSETNFAVMTTMEDKRQSKNKHSAFVRQEHLNSSVDHQLQDDDENDSEDSENASSTVNQLNPMTNDNDELEEKRLRRRRLTPQQIAFLESQYQRDPVFTSMRISQLAKQLNLGRTKVYKWTWDRRKKGNCSSD